MPNQEKYTEQEILDLFAAHLSPLQRTILRKMINAHQQGQPLWIFKSRQTGMTQVRKVYNQIINLPQFLPSHLKK